MINKLLKFMNHIFSLLLYNIFKLWLYIKLWFLYAVQSSTQNKLMVLGVEGLLFGI